MHKYTIFFLLIALGIGSADLWAMEEHKSFDNQENLPEVVGLSKFIWNDQGEVSCIVERGKDSIDHLGNAVLGGLEYTVDGLSSRQNTEVTKAFMLFDVLFKNCIKNNKVEDAHSAFGCCPNPKTQYLAIYSNNTCGYAGPKNLKEGFLEDSYTVLKQLKKFRQDQQLLLPKKTGLESNMEEKK